MEDASEVHWAKPIGPTPQLSSMEYLPVPSSDSYIFCIDALWVLPGPLDTARVKEAVAYALRDYGHCAGRLCYDAEKSKWRINLGENQGIPVTFVTTDALGIEAESSDIERHPGVMEPPDYYPPDNDILATLPLIKFKVMRWEKTGETSFHVRFCHALGDGSVITGCVTAISYYYQNLPPPPVPTYEKYLMTIPTFQPHELEEFRPTLHWHDFSYPMDEFAPIFFNSMSTTCRVDLNFSPQQLNAIHAFAKKSTNGWISAQDSLSAFLTHLVRIGSPTHIRHVFQVLNYRGFPAAAGSAFIPPPITSTGNCIINVAVNTEDLAKTPEPTFGFLADMIRRSIVYTKEPERFPKLLAASTAQFEQSLKKELITYPPPDHTVSLNNFVKGSYHSQHFGYAGRTKFYHLQSCENMFHIWPSNPVKLRNGEWKSQKGGLDVEFRIKEELKPIFMENLTSYLRMMEGDDGATRSRL